jgi:hypothetical protein
VQQRLDTERAKTRDVVKSYCPTCGEYAPRYSIADLTDVTDMMKVPVMLFPCTHTVVWDTIRREQETVSLVDEDLVRLYESDLDLVALHKHGHNAGCAVCDGDDYVSSTPVYPCDTLRIRARGYGIQPTPGDDHAGPRPQETP